jgi:hypothetical protein
MKHFRTLRPNWSVDSDTLRQGAARRRWKSCTVRPLAATCRSPSRYVAADQRRALLLPPGHAAGSDHRFMPLQQERRETNEAVRRSWSDLGFSLSAAAGAADIANRTAAGSTSLGLAPHFFRGRRRAQSMNASPRFVAGGAHNRAVDTDALSARFRWPTVRRSPLR